MPWADPKLSVGFPFFNRSFVPMMVPMIIAVGIGPMLAWKRGDILGALQRLWVAYIATALVLLVAFYVTYGGPVLAVLGLGLSAWLFAAVLTEFAERVRLFRVPFGGERPARDQPAAFGLRDDVRASRAGGVGRRLCRVAVRAGGDRDPQARRQHLDRRLSPDAGECDRLPGPNYIADDAAIRVTRDGGASWSRDAPRTAVLPVATADHRRDGDPHQSAGRPVCRAGRCGHRRRLDGAGLLEAAGALDLDRRDHHGVRRRGQPERSALAGRCRRAGAAPQRAAAVPAAGE